MAKSGVKQGCPLSPLVVSICVDVLLRYLQFRIPSIHLRAFADDVGAVFRSLQDIATSIGVFIEFGTGSNLKLNFDKCILIPLWGASVALARLKLGKLGTMPQVLRLTFALYAK